MAQPAPAKSNRRDLTLVAAAAIVGLAVVAVVVALAGRGRVEEAGLGAEGPYRGSEPPARITLPGFDLASYRGGSVSAADLRGSVVLLTLLDSQCTDACPVLATVVAGAVDRLTAAERREVRAIAVTADPSEDTVANVRRFLRQRRAEGRLDHLLGEERELRPFWRALYVLPSLDSGRDEIHSAPLRIYDRDGVWVATLHAGVDLDEANLLHDIRRALRATRDDTG